MAVFVDTSALYAFLDRDDARNASAVGYLGSLADTEPLLTHNYVVLETVALVQRRLGVGALRALVEDVVPGLEVRWVDEDVHRAAVSAMLAGIRRRVSLVDWVSFEMMRRARVRTAFAFDRDFAAQGFDTVP